MLKKLFEGKDPHLVVEQYNFIDKECIIYIEQQYIDYDVIYSFYCALNRIINHKNKIKKVKLIVECDMFATSACILFMEIILARFFEKRPHIIFSYNVKFKQQSGITFIFFNETVLKKFFNKEIDKPMFINEVLYQKRNKFYNDGCFRWHLNIEGENDALEVSLMASELESYLKKEYINDDLVDNIIEVISELSSNACEHALSDCYIYCFVEDGINNLNNQNCTLVDMTILDFSDISLYGTLKHDFSNRYENVKEKVKEAYQYHKNYLCKQYDLNCFFIVSVFQNKITTRKDNGDSTGGTGLARFIQTVEPIVKDNYCHLFTNKYLMLLEKNYIVNNIDEIGFNDSGRYRDDIPNTNVFDIKEYSINGTLFSILLEIDRRE